MDVLSHRGSWSAHQGNDGSHFTENTVPAFRRALEEGADGFECDVHRTADDQLVVHHDADAEGLGLLAHHDLAAIRRIRPEIPTLTETLDSCLGYRCNIEIKNLPTDADFDPTHRVVALIADLLSDREGRDRIIVSSFNLSTMDECRARMPDTSMGWLIGSGIDPVAAVSMVRDHGLDALHPSVVGLSALMLERLTAAAFGIEVNVWTVNDPQLAAMLGAAGVTSVITDDVPAMRAALG